MAQYIEHNKTSQAVMQQQAARPQNVGTRIAQTDFFAYICMFITLFNYTMEKKNKKQSLKKKPFIPVAEMRQLFGISEQFKKGNSKRTERWLR